MPSAMDTGRTADPEHSHETYRSLIQISVEGFRFLALLNGGAAVALVAYLGNLAAKGAAPGPDVRWPLGAYLVGLVLCAFCFLTSYRTQFAVYNELQGRIRPRMHMWWVRATVGLALGSLVAFSVGSWWAVVALGPH
jgi:hypothetical protein